MTGLHVVWARNQDWKVGRGLCRCDIADRVGDWCGSIVLDEDWIEKHEERGVQTHLEFIALSEARSFTDDECLVVSIPKLLT
jgi:hypothetical protein